MRIIKLSNKFFHRNLFWLVPVLILLFCYDIYDRKVYQKEAEQRGKNILKNDSILVKNQDTMKINRDIDHLRETLEKYK